MSYQSTNLPYLQPGPKPANGDLKGGCVTGQSQSERENEKEIARTPGPKPAMMG